NRLQESMKLFSSICNNVFFRSTSMKMSWELHDKRDIVQYLLVLLVNFFSINNRKANQVLLNPPGVDCDVDLAARFIVAAFVSLNNMPKKLIYHHFTTATDTSNIQVVFQVVMDTIIKENLEAVSLL
ncbi:hypothetical protein XENOCAPTIV_000292, partial [Xenoophorus captivus]